MLYVTKRKLIDGPFCVSDRKKFEKIRKNQKKSSVSKKNCPPGDPLGGPKSLLEAKKSLLEMKIRASDAFWRSMIDF